MTYDVVVPTRGRPSLTRLLESLTQSDGPEPGRVILVDDRPGTELPRLVEELPYALARRIQVLRSYGRGPAAARNRGWQAATAPWVVFLDDDVTVTEAWRSSLTRDLERAGRAGAAGSQGRILVPLPEGRPPTDAERGVRGLEQARWATADMAYRRSVLRRAGGFDERFPRAYREDADLALRVMNAGEQLVRGDRQVVHLVPRAGFWSSVHRQAGNADDALMRRLHGYDWRARSGSFAGARPRHVALTLTAAAALAMAAARRRRAALAAAATWLAGTAAFTWERVAPGPRTPGEVFEMAVTSTVVPAAATWHWLRGSIRARRLVPKARPGAVLFDRDGTLVEDVPYNGDPELVRPRPGAREALDRLRSLGIPVAVVSNQSGVARGLVTPEQVFEVNRRIDELLGPIDAWLVCLHGPDEECDCRKPQPGLLRAAAAELGVAQRRCVMIGDIGADVEAARAAGARAILVPTEVTRPEEVASAPEVAPDLAAAVGRLLGEVA